MYTKFTKNIDLAVDVIKSSGLVIYPTETSYGLGCDATNENAIKKLYKIKKRNKPISIIVADLKMAKKYCIIDDYTKKIIKKFMPGPLTLIVKKKNLPDILSKETIAFRISSNKIATELSKKSGKPITSTSANISGLSSIYSINKLKKTFDKKVDLIIDAGNLKKRKASTIYDIKKRKFLRIGDIIF